jgi:transcriptional regulator with XRE-family HTH domain
MTQEDVARRAGCSVSYVRLLEGGYLPASGAKLDAVRNAITGRGRTVRQDDDPAGGGVAERERDAAALRQG